MSLLHGELLIENTRSPLGMAVCMRFHRRAREAFGPQQQWAGPGKRELSSIQRHAPLLSPTVD